MTKERIKDYRKLCGQSYFRGNTAARLQRIRKLQKRIFAKRLRQGFFSFYYLMDKGVI